MEEKKYQVIDWSASNFAEGKIVISLSTYQKYDDVAAVVSKKNYVIAIGYNPSNKTYFNDDVTNLYLRDKIAKKFREQDVCGYLLVNLIPTINSNPKRLGINDVDELYINEIIDLISNNEKARVILFFGQMGIKLLKKRTNNLDKLEEIIKKNSTRIWYTSRPKAFIHPGRSGDDYEIVQWKNDLLK